MLLQEDFDNFIDQLAEYPKMGDVIPGLSEARK